MATATWASGTRGRWRDTGSTCTATRGPTPLTGREKGASSARADKHTGDGDLHVQLGGEGGVHRGVAARTDARVSCRWKRQALRPSDRLGILLYLDDEYYIGSWHKDQKHGLGVRGGHS
eukprot:750733-Hanusia_phi.AAC.3